jgi:hypothetical protein
MVDLKDVGDYVVLVLIAAAAGGFGGLAATMVPTSSPGVNKPRLLTGPIVGATAAVAVLIVFPGTEETTKVVAGAAVSTTKWSVIKVVPISVIAGWAGPKVLGVLQDRLVAASKDAQLQATVSVAKEQVQQIADRAGTSVQEHAATTTAEELAPAVQSSLESEVSSAQAMIDAAATPA